MNGIEARLDSTSHCVLCVLPGIVLGPKCNAIACEKREGKGNEWVREWRENERWGEGAD